MNTYHLFVFRKRRSETERIFEQDFTHQVCAIYQVVDLFTSRWHMWSLNAAM